MYSQKFKLQKNESLGLFLVFGHLLAEETKEEWVGPQITHLVVDQVRQELGFEVRVLSFFLDDVQVGKDRRHTQFLFA